MANKVKDQALNGLGSLLKLLPTGTIFLYQFLSPVLSNNGQCHPVNKYLTGALIVLSALNCALATFTDSYTDDEGATHYGIATFKGMWPSNKENGAEMAKYRIRGGDFVHAIMSIVVFGVVALLDRNTLDCFAPTWESTRKTLIMVLPPVVGSVCSAVFAVFPSTRHGIGYPSNN